VAEAYTQAIAEGRGAISVGGKMIDAANLRMAQTILDRQRQIDARAERG
jgi:citrate lyase beta subunit